MLLSLIKPPSLIKPLTIAATLGCLALAGHAQARDLRMAPGVPPAHPAHTPLYTGFVELLQAESDDRLGGQILGTEIASIGNMRYAIRSGLVEAGLFLPAYFPADLPEINLVGDPHTWDDFAFATREELVVPANRIEDQGEIAKRELDGAFSEVVFDIELARTDAAELQVRHKRPRAKEDEQDASSQLAGAAKV